MTYPSRKVVQELVRAGLVEAIEPTDGIAISRLSESRPRFFVPLSVPEFVFATRAAQAAQSGRQMPLNSEAVRGRNVFIPGVGVTRLVDSPVNRGMYAAGETFGDDQSKAESFYWRTVMIVPLTARRRYQRYVRHDREIHVGMMVAIAGVEGHSLMSSKEIRAAFDAEVWKQIKLHSATKAPR